MVLGKHNKHSTKHKKEMRKHNIVGRFSERAPLWTVKPLQILTMCYFSSVQALTKHD